MKELSISHAINNIIEKALILNASDIHFEPYASRYRIRYRIYGLLEEALNPDLSLAERFSARLKVMAQLNIAEKRLPQDGHFKFGKDSVDIRISTSPTYYGEKIALRLLNKSPQPIHIAEIGLEKAQETLIRETLLQSHGLILVTGPTGSGKTITLYSLLNELNTVERNICTVEDPIEIHLAGINQVQVNPAIGFGFSQTLRHFLRQDPDIIMIGEIRDSETAEIAIKAAQTGHLVLATLHSPSAKEACNRLLSLGISSFNLESVLKLVISQRLVRCLCSKCKKPQPFRNHILLEKDFFKTNQDIQHFQAEGCLHCHKGFLGRTGIFETLSFIKNNHIMTLKQSGLAKIAMGITSLDELSRVL